MKFFNRVALAIAVLAMAACAAPVNNADHGPAASHKFGASGGPGGSQYCYWQTNLPAVTGNTATITLFDTTAGGTQRGIFDFMQRMMVVGNVDQTVTVNYDIQMGTSTTWVRAAGTNASYSFAGGTTTTGTTEVDHLVQGNESRIQVVTGATGPTASRWALRLCFVRDLGQ
jgi:hypothetical protein